MHASALHDMWLCCRDRAHREDEQRYNTAHALADNHIAEEAAAAGRAGNTLPVWVRRLVHGWTSHGTGSCSCAVCW